MGLLLKIWVNSITAVPKINAAFNLNFSILIVIPIQFNLSSIIIVSYGTIMVLLIIDFLLRNISDILYTNLWPLFYHHSCIIIFYFFPAPQLVYKSPYVYFFVFLLPNWCIRAVNPLSILSILNL